MYKFHIVSVKKHIGFPCHKMKSDLFDCKFINNYVKIIIYIKNNKIYNKPCDYEIKKEGMERIVLLPRYYLKKNRFLGNF